MAVAALVEAPVMTATNVTHFLNAVLVTGHARKRCVALLFALLTLLAPASVSAQNYAVVVSGLGGESQFTDQFAKTGKAVFESLQSLDVQDDRVVYLGESATRDTILSAIDDIASRINQDQHSVFSLYLIGHGNADSSGWRFNVSGPDITTEDLIVALNPVKASTQLVVLAASSSGAALDILAQPQRVVVSATKSGGENNAVKFPQFLEQALRVSDADYDRNEILTIAEVFRYVQNQTVQYYEQEKLIAPEHARLKGDNAADIPVSLLGSLQNATDDPVVASLLAERLLLEGSFKKLTSAKSTLSSTDYYAQLEQLLLKIARLQVTIDAATGWSDRDAES